LVAVGCSDSESSGNGPATSTPEVATRGGTLVVGAFQEPACADWLAACGNSSWGNDMMANQTLPRAFDLVDNQYRPSPLLVGEPTIEVGPPQRVTLRIEPRAVWSDGHPITSSDFRYTVEQVRATTPGQAFVSSVDDRDPKVAIATFTEPTAAWRDSFRRILPGHLLEGKDRGAEMRDGYRFSGGPWMIDHWTKGQEVKLVPNPTYWGTKPNLDAVVFKVITDSAAYQAAYKTGQLDMIYVQGAQPETAELRLLPDTHFDASIGLGFEFVMFNVQKPPLDSKTVRQALAYATDRDVIVAQLSAPLMPGVKAIQAFVSPGNSHWYTEPFKRYARDLAKISQLMTGDGWAKGPDGIWVKAGSRAVIELTTHVGNRRRELTQQILQSQWKEAGFEATVRNGPASTVNGEWLPRGTFQAAIYGISPFSPDPNRCSVFCSKNTPTEANGFQGIGVSRLASPVVDEAWGAVEKELDDAKRVDFQRKAQEAVADEVPGVPLSPGVDVIVYNTAKVGGPVKVGALGAFAQINEWFCKSCK
jgi:peptide/nickel transport system substrate-binding protein